MLKLTLLMPVGTGTVLRKQLDGLKIVSMKVGAFIVVERDAVLEFTDFVIGQLVGFKKNGHLYCDSTASPNTVGHLHFLSALFRNFISVLSIQ